MHGTPLLPSSRDNSPPPPATSAHRTPPRKNGASPRPTRNGQNATDGEAQTGMPPKSTLPPSEGPDQWSSAVGHATTGGKSGRVIEKLQSQVDALKRDLREQQTKSDELQRNMQMVKPRIESLESENENLSHLRSVDNGRLERRDRQVTDLKAELAKEKEKRERFEKLSQCLANERDDAFHEKDREVAVATEKALYHESQYTALRKSFLHAKQEYHSKESAKNHHIETVLQPEVKRLQGILEQEAVTMAKLDIIIAQLKQENERERKLNAEMVALFGDYKKDKEDQAQRIQAESQRVNESQRKLSMEMDAVVGQMRRVMNLKQNTTLDESDAADPRKDSKEAEKRA